MMAVVRNRLSTLPFVELSTLLLLLPGRSIQVPSVLVHKFDGVKIKNALASEVVQLSMTWSLPEPDGRVEAALWTSSENDEVGSRLLLVLRLFCPALC